ncbi:MAG: SIS domain-containing protein [Gammaproteobacteria bacterium]|nr:SIS domain-containing protein [Gammaproteobacteria bacterium]
MISQLIEQDARETPDCIKQQLIENESVAAELGERLRELSPKFILMVGRGSSDHAGVFGKYLIEIEMSTPVVAAAPSVKTVYSCELNLAGSAVILISQSGKASDILSQAEMAKKQGALCIALVNDEASPLVQLADVILPLKSGQEQALVATKSYLATLSALLQLVAHWKNDSELISDVNKLPTMLANTASESAQLKPSTFKAVKSLVVMGRGFGYALAREVALKLKQVCVIQAEAYSSEEFLHGSEALIADGLHIISLDLKDESKKSHDQQVCEFKLRGANVSHMTPTSRYIPNRIAPLTLLLRFYIDIALIAAAKECDLVPEVELSKAS